MYRFIVACLLLVLARHSLADDCNVVVTVSDIFPPYNMKAEDGTWNGLAVDMSHNVLFGAKCTATVLSVPWQRTMAMLEKGEVDMVPLTTITEERSEFAYFVGPIYLEQTVFVAKQAVAERIDLSESLRDFKGSIGKTNGTIYSASVEKIVRQPEVARKILLIRSDENKINMLNIGRIDGMFEELAVAEYMFKINRLNRKKFPIVMRFLPNPVYFALSKKTMSGERLHRIRLSWRQMMAEGSVENIYRHYGLSMPDLANLDYSQR